MRQIIKIYVLKDSSYSELLASEGNSSKDFLVNLNKGDIDSTQFIRVGSKNIGIPGFDLSVDDDGKNYKVEEESNFSYVTLVNNQGDSPRRFYIRDSNDTSDNIPTPQVFTFHINPSRLSPSYRKLISEVRTRGGWSIQHWGNALSDLKIEGKTGSFIDPDTLSLEDYDITKSIAWTKIKELKDLYYKNNQVPTTAQDVNFALNFYDKLYLGYFTEFTGPEAEENSPFIMTYGFNFRVIQEVGSI